MIQHHGDFLLLKYPAQWNDPPVFHLGQRVQLGAANTGTVFGLDYVAVGSWEHQQKIEPGWHYKVSWDGSCPRSVSFPVELCHQTEIQPLLPSVQPIYTKLLVS